MKIESYQDLIVWQRGMELVAEIYKLTKLLPKSEDYALSSQMRRAVIGIPSNIAEGYGRKNTKEYIQFLHIAISSSFELETQLLIARKIYNTRIDQAASLVSEVKKMLFSIILKLKKR